MSAAKCPSCQQVNDADMVFCIFCGSSLKPGKLTGRVPLLGAITCQACRKADVLNELFCVFCGAEITGSGNVQIPSEILADNGAGSSPSRRMRRSGTNLGMIMLGLTLSLVLGAGAGAALSVVTTKPVVLKPLAESGLVVADGPAYADVLIVNQDPHNEDNGRNFVMGRSGPTGSFIFADLDPARYEVSIGDAFKQLVPIPSGHALTLNVPAH